MKRTFRLNFFSIVLVGEHEAVPFYSLQVVLAEGTKIVLALSVGLAIKQVGFAPAALPAAVVAAICSVAFLRLATSVPRERDATGVRPQEAAGGTSGEGAEAVD